MGHARSLHFDALEERELLSAARVAASHRVTPKIQPVALVLNGTLQIDNAAATTNEDDDGDMITTTPVSGTLGSLGAVRGTWNTGVDSFGDYMGPDTLDLHNAKGGIVIEFNDQQHGKAKAGAKGAAYYQVPQALLEGSSAYAEASERGTLNLNSNSARTAIVSMTFNTTSS